MPRKGPPNSASRVSRNLAWAVFFYEISKIKVVSSGFAGVFVLSNDEIRWSFMNRKEGIRPFKVLSRILRFHPQ
ncbi:MAG: hypothetical protein ACOCU5_01265 [Bacillota bacterium]